MVLRFNLSYYIRISMSDNLQYFKCSNNQMCFVNSFCWCHIMHELDRHPHKVSVIGQCSSQSDQELLVNEVSGHRKKQKQSEEREKKRKKKTRKKERKDDVKTRRNEKRRLRMKERNKRTKRKDGKDEMEWRCIESKIVSEKGRM